MKNVKALLEYNREFVKEKKYETLITNKYPNKKVAVLSCMDSRLTELLPSALGLKNGDTVMIKNAGAVVSHPFGSIMRSLLIAIYDLGVEEIMVIAHDDCGMQNLTSSKFIEKMQTRGIEGDQLDTIRYFGIDLNKWLAGFENTQDAVLGTVGTIRRHPLIPEDIQIYGFIMNSETGELSPVKP